MYSKKNKHCYSQHKILITGASGFLGSCLSHTAISRGYSVTSVFRDVRSDNVHSSGIGQSVVVTGIDADTNWSNALQGVDVVIHCAARVHVMNDNHDDPLEAFRVVNVHGTLNLARQAAEVGVRRFVFVSSIKVNGECTKPGVAFNFADRPCPQDAYGISKYEAEMGLRQVAIETGMEVVIVRPPLVYGPRVKGNFLTMVRWLRCRVPLPLGAVTRNRRSLVALDNLVDLLVTCIDHPAAAHQTFLVSDGEDLSTAELLRRIAHALKQHIRLLNVPVGLLVFMVSLLGKKVVAERLLGSLQVDISHTCKTLGWKPPISVNEGLRRAVQGLGK